MLTALSRMNLYKRSDTDIIMIILFLRSGTGTTYFKQNCLFCAGDWTQDLDMLVTHSTTELQLSLYFVKRDFVFLRYIVEYLWMKQYYSQDLLQKI
jgi:hypothetical protein